MSIANCPKCREEVSVPADASRQARVRCPLCSEEYLLNDVLRGLPPLLVVLEDPEAKSEAFLDDAPKALPRFSVGQANDASSLATEDVAQGFDFEPAPVSAAAAPAFNFDPQSSVSRPSSVTPRARPRRKEGSMLRMMVQTIGGGMLGLIIAQLILWWMPGNWASQNRDPFGLAEKVSPYVPAIVPRTLRGSVPTAQVGPSPGTASPDTASPDTLSPDTLSPETAQPNNSTTSPASSDSTPSKELDTNIPDFSFKPGSGGENSKEAAARKKKGKDAKQPAAKEEFPLIGANETVGANTASTNEPNTAPAPEITLDPLEAPKASSGKKKQSPSAEGPRPSESTVPTEIPDNKKSTGVPATPSVDAAQVQARLRDVAAAEMAWDTADKSSPTIDRKKLITDLYLKLAQLGEAIVQNGPTTSDSKAVLQPVVDKLVVLSKASDKLTAFGNLAGLRLDEDRDKGVIAVGVVVSHQPAGKFYETQLQLLAKSQPTIKLVSQDPLGEQLSPNTTVLVLGRWVSNPADNLPGYRGNAESVLVNGAHIIIAPKTQP